MGHSRGCAPSALRVIRLQVAVTRELAAADPQESRRSATGCRNRFWLCFVAQRRSSLQAGDLPYARPDRCHYQT